MKKIKQSALQRHVWTHNNRSMKWQLFLQECNRIAEWHIQPFEIWMTKRINIDKTEANKWKIKL